MLSLSVSIVSYKLAQEGSSSQVSSIGSQPSSDQVSFSAGALSSHTAQVI